MGRKSLAIVNQMRLVFVFTVFNLFVCSAVAKSKKDIPKDVPLKKIVQIVISGNKVTKPQIILNELTFCYGDSLSVSGLESAITQSRNNLLNTSLFNFVSITYSFDKKGDVVLRIKVDERWYWWAFPILEHADRNFSAFLQNGDWSRVNYGVYIKKDNFRGRRETLKFRLRLGYATQITIGFHSPEYKSKIGWGADFDMKTNDQIPYADVDNKPVFITSIHEPAQLSYNASVFSHYRRNHYQRHRVALVYYDYEVADSVVLLNPDYLTTGDAQLRYLNLRYAYSYDRRDSKVYPLKGRFFGIELSKRGFGVWDNGLNEVNVSVGINEHVELLKHLYYGAGFSAFASSRDELPYVMRSGIGYSGFLNGYEFYAINGTRSAVLKQKVLFALLPPREQRIGFMPLTQFSKMHYAFYLSAYFDAGYVWNKQPLHSNEMANTLQYGYGVGIDFVTFYDKILSFNYSQNKYGEHGFFVHVNIDM